MTRTLTSAEESFRRYQGDADFIRGRAALQSAAGEDAHRVLVSTAILLLHPLCLSTGRVPAAADWLRRHSFRVEHCQRIRLTNEHLRRVWKYQIAEHDARRVRVVSQLLTHGPSVLMAVVEEVPGEVPAVTRLRALKGPADPYRAAPQHLRRHLGSANMFNNLVHTSDGPGELLRESAALLDEPDLLMLWHRSAAALRGAGAAQSPALPDTPARSLPGGISLAHVAIRLRRSLLSRLIPLLPVSASELVTGLEAAVDDEEGWASTQDPARPIETLAEFRRMFRPISARFERVAAMSGHRVQARALAGAFVEIERALFASGFDAERLEATAARAGLQLDVRDRVVFATESLSLRYSS